MSVHSAQVCVTVKDTALLALVLVLVLERRWNVGLVYEQLNPSATRKTSGDCGGKNYCKHNKQF